MTREEQIKLIAFETSSNDYPISEYEGFVRGAKWADEHPSSALTEMKTELTKNIGDVEKIRYDSLNCQKNVLLKWSEEDDKILDKIVNCLMGIEKVECADYNIMYNWLKSIKQRMKD